VHELNQGPREVGKAAFREFLQRMEYCYSEQLVDIAAARSPTARARRPNTPWSGEYVADDIGMPPRAGRNTACPVPLLRPAGDGRIPGAATIQLQEWFSQVAQAEMIPEAACAGAVDRLLRMLGWFPGPCAASGIRTKAATPTSASTCSTAATGSIPPQREMGTGPSRR
jgi:hypothetical protein